MVVQDKSKENGSVESNNDISCDHEILGRARLSSMVSSGIREEELLKSIDAGMDIFGKSVKSVIYWRFETIYNSKREDVPRKPELFSESLRSFFGERAFKVEASIVGSIIDNFHLLDVRLSDSLPRAIVEARNKIRSMS